MSYFKQALMERQEIFMSDFGLEEAEEKEEKQEVKVGSSLSDNDWVDTYDRGRYE